MPRKELGKGWSFPIRIDRSGGISMSAGQQDVEEAIRIILSTSLGERVMRSLFGSDVPGILFEPATSGTAARLTAAVQSALARWEPRIDVLSVLVEPDPLVPTHFVASLSYRLREDNSILNLVYPFYLTEGTEDS